MPPSSTTRQDGAPPSSPTTTISIVLILVIPTVLLIGLCAARKTPLFASIRTTTHRSIRRPPKDPGAVAGHKALRTMPVVKYNHKPFTSLENDTETGYCEEKKWDDDATMPRDQHLLWGVVASLKGLFWSKTNRFWRFSFHRDAIEAATPEIWATKAAVRSCVVCTEDFRTGVDVRKLPCGHIFHPGCIDPWLLSFAATCPLCRVDLRVKEAESELVEPPAVVVARHSGTAV